MIAVVPFSARNWRWIASSSSRWWTVTPGASATPAYLAGSSVTMTSFATPSATSVCMICGTEWPSGRSPTRWPPVIATASL